MEQRLVADAELGAQRHILPVAVIADAIHDELLRNELCDPHAQCRLYQVQHQVQRGDPAGAGETVTVDREELVTQQNAREFLAQGR